MNRSKTQMRRLVELDALMRQDKFPNCPSFAAHWEVSSKTIHPLHLANLQGAWYLFVRFYDYDNFRQLALGRIEKARSR